MHTTWGREHSTCASDPAGLAPVPSTPLGACRPDSLVTPLISSPGRRNGFPLQHGCSVLPALELYANGILLCVFLWWLPPSLVSEAHRLWVRPHVRGFHCVDVPHFPCC